MHSNVTIKNVSWLHFSWSLGVDHGCGGQTDRMDGQNGRSNTVRRALKTIEERQLYVRLSVSECSLSSKASILYLYELVTVRASFSQ